MAARATGPATLAVRRAVADALDRHVLAGPRGPVAVAVACSGGPDSLALAAAAAHEAPRRGLTVTAIVVDHGLQPGSADRAGEAAAALERLGVPAAVVAVDVAGPGGPEAAARRARYAALDRARPPGAPVLLGHTLDDQAETVLLGLGRGSGARSLAGMRVWDSPWLRPLLGVRRAVPDTACAEAGLQPWRDPHNADPRFVRARLRAEVLPLLEDVLAGGVAEALARTAAQLADDDAALRATATARRAQVEGREGATTPGRITPGITTPGRTTLDAEALAADPPAVRRRVLRAWLADVGVTGFDDAHLRHVDALVTDRRGRSAPPLPGGLVVTRRRGKLHARPVGGGRTAPR